MTAKESISISFDDIFGSAPEEITPEKFNQFLEGVIENSIQKINHSPNELVRIVDNGQINWVTAAEAEEILQDKQQTDNESLREKLQNALRGDSNFLEKEIRILFMLAYGSMQKYQQNNLIPRAEIQRAEPQFLRLGRQISFQLSELRDVETRITEVRHKNPIIDQFEQKMGRLLTHQKAGEHNKATELAVELTSMKKKYLFLSRGLLSETNTAYRIRREIQQLKISVLSWQRYLFSQREGVLETEIQNQRKSAENLKFLLSKETDDKKEVYHQELKESEEIIQKKTQELMAVQKGQAVLIVQENETESIVHEMDQTLQGSEQEEKKEPEKEKPVLKEDKTEEMDVSEEKSKKRMVTIQRYKNR